MKLRFTITFCIVALIFVVPAVSKAQFYQLANTLTNVVTPAISGAGSYQGFVEAGYSHTLNPYPGDFVEISTTQGYRYKSWFFMGVGLGIDGLFAHKNDNWGQTWQPPVKDRPIVSKAVMLPLFSDFRFIIGSVPSQAKASFYIDLKIGCSFLMSKKYVAIGDGILTNQQYFFLRPSVGVRIPVSKKNVKQAVNIGINYKLLASNYWIGYNNDVTLQALGASVAFEW